jgi:hypothetical protein
MTAADGRELGDRNRRAGDTMVGLNGAPIDRSRYNHPSSSHEWIPELSLAADPAESPEHPGQQANAFWPPDSVSPWPVAKNELEMERARLESEIAAATARTLAARHHDSVMRAALHEEVVASQQALAEMERLHHLAVAAIREAAQAEAARIVLEARQQVTRRAGRVADTESGNP